MLQGQNADVQAQCWSERSQECNCLPNPDIISVCAVPHTALPNKALMCHGQWEKQNNRDSLGHKGKKKYWTDLAWSQV